jgi:Tfp pilus assembly protein PilF/VanZ family protein
MRSRLLLAVGLAALVCAVLAENLFGRQLDAFFLEHPGIDKLLHTLEYCLVVVAVHAMLRWTEAIRSAHVVWVAIGFALGLAALDETAQRLFPARSVEALDFIANLAGITLGWVFIQRSAPRLRLAAAGLALATTGFTSYRTYATLIDYSRALGYERRHDFISAREHYRRALASGLRTPGLFNELGWVEIESGVGDPKQAIEYARTALEMQPHNPDIVDTYGWALLHAGRTQEAVEALERAYAANPEMFCIHYHLGAAYLAAGKRDAAREHFARQLEKPDTREAAFAKAALDHMTASETDDPRGASSAVRFDR